MEYSTQHFSIDNFDGQFHLEGYPDAVKLIKIEGKQAKRLSDTALHKSDLVFANECLDTININFKTLSHVAQQALWRSAIIHYMKCFGDSKARFQLNFDKIYKNEPPQAKQAFEYYKDLRNKHFIHDENSYAQSLPGAILNKESAPYKIERIVTLSLTANTLMKENWGNLKLLIVHAIIWTDKEYQALVDILIEELEKRPYADLAACESVRYKVPTLEEIPITRSNHL